tara:strand:- start:284 stop:430 length:147 start_codon:yes stop_codon:yes gene_type:complete
VVQAELERRERKVQLVEQVVLVKQVLRAELVEQVLVELVVLERKERKV